MRIQFSPEAVGFIPEVRDRLCRTSLEAHAARLAAVVINHGLWVLPSTGIDHSILATGCWSLILSSCMKLNMDGTANRRIPKVFHFDIRHSLFDIRYSFLEVSCPIKLAASAASG